MELFNPRKKEYKTPYGAVPTGTNVTFSTYPLMSDGFTGGELVAELEGEKQVRLPLQWSGRQGIHDRFSVTLDTQGFMGLVWYYFRLTGLDGKEKYIRPEKDPYHGVYQLTVFQEEAVPTWFGEGMCYQIFPDRFHRSKLPDVTGMDRTVHKDWNEAPLYLPDEKGEVRNRDFFGGDIQGIIEKLEYLDNLGVETIYLCPIFYAPENHRYGTADYEIIDPMLGTLEDFQELCTKAHEKNMKIMLDGVFNHVGFYSRYFNAEDKYDTVGAYQSKESPYYPWFDFHNWPKEYDSWWGFYSLPSPNSSSPAYQRFIYDDKESVVRKWLRAGADGWRLDVVDEIPDEFVAGIHRSARLEKSSAVVIGEVWEDGSTKEAYGIRRKHVLGGHCDGLMNYPFRLATLDFFNGGSSGNFVESMETLRENYPQSAFYSSMNALGTHDTLRILTLFGFGGDALNESKTWRYEYKLSPLEILHGTMKLKSAMALLFSFPGSPTVYYGDEAGCQGFEDPFNRFGYPWGREDKALLSWVSTLGQLRKVCDPLRKGSISYLSTRSEVLGYVRTYGKKEVLCLFNNFEHSQRVNLSWFSGKTLRPLACTEESYRVEESKMVIPPYFGGLFEILHDPT